MALDWRDFKANCLQTMNNNTKLETIITMGKRQQTPLLQVKII